MTTIDALVVGGGPGGLTAALYLARFRRSVLVVDAGRSRAAKIPRSHNVAGFPDGVAGNELVAAMRSHAERHGARIEAAEVEAIERRADGSFVARWPGGEAAARVLLLATGAHDVEPRMPHLADAVREGALRYCPVCDGFEVSGRSIGLVTDSASDVDEALFLRHFSDRITLFFAEPGIRHSDEQRRRLDAAGIAVASGVIGSIRRRQGAVTVRHGDEETTCDSLYSALGLVVHSELAAALGARCEDGGCLATDAHYQTTVPGLYAVGDVAAGLNQIGVACGGAAIASAAMHRALGI